MSFSNESLPSVTNECRVKRRIIRQTPSNDFQLRAPTFSINVEGILGLECCLLYTWAVALEAEGFVTKNANNIL